MVGEVGGLLEGNDSNISFMHLGREKVRGRALMVLGLDDEMSPEMLEQLQSIPDIHSARQAQV